MKAFSRAEAFTRQLQADLTKAARCQAAMVAIIVEMATEVNDGRVVVFPLGR